MPLSEHLIGEMVSQDLTDALKNITDVFMGGDGGGDFVLFCGLIRELDERAVKGDEAAKQLTDVVRKFNKLILFVRKHKRD